MADLGLSSPALVEPSGPVIVLPAPPSSPLRQVGQGNQGRARYSRSEIQPAYHGQVFPPRG